MPTFNSTSSFSDGGINVSSSSTIIAEAAESFGGNPDFVIPANQTDMHLDVAWVNSTVSQIYIRSSVAMTIKTNSSSVPDQIISLPAGKAIEWRSDMVYDNPFTEDVTALYVTNTASGSFLLRIGRDGTP